MHLQETGFRYMKCIYRQAVHDSNSMITFTKDPVVLYDNLQRESHKPCGHPTSVMKQQMLRKQTNTGTSTSLTAGTMTHAHTNSRTLPTCDISRGSLTLPAPEAGIFVELILLHSPWLTEHVLHATSVCSVRFTSRILLYRNIRYRCEIGKWRRVVW